jgi:hypothetical protein
MSFWKSASSIKIKPIPRAAKYGIVLATPSRPPFPPDLLSQTKGMSRNATAITTLPFNRFSIVSGTGFSYDKK